VDSAKQYKTVSICIHVHSQYILTENNIIIIMKNYILLYYMLFIKWTLGY